MDHLTESKSYKVSHEYEVVILERVQGADVVIGDFIGDPTCAVISPSEKWCAIGGAGLIIYFLKEPFEPYKYDHSTKQWIEFGRESDDTWWIESLTATSDNKIKFITDPYSNRPGTYLYEISTGKLDTIG